MKKIIISVLLIFGIMFPSVAENCYNIVPVPNKIIQGEGKFLVERDLVIVSDDVKDFSAL